MFSILQALSFVLQFFTLPKLPLDEINAIKTTTEDLGLVWQTIQHDGGTRRVLEYVPDSLESNPALVILFHGLGGNPSVDFTPGVPSYNKLLDIAEEKGFMLASPQAEKVHIFGINTLFLAGWNDYGKWWLQPKTDDVGFVEVLIDCAVQNRNVDPARVFVAGVSGGGTLVYRLLNERSSLFAAAAPIISSLQKDIPPPQSYVPTPVITVVGKSDPHFRYQGGPSLFFNTRSVEDSLAYIANLNGLDTSNKVQATDQINDDCRIDSILYESDTAPVEAYVMENSGHLLPGTDLYIFYAPVHPFIFGPIVCNDGEFVFISKMVAFFERYGL